MTPFYSDPLVTLLHGDCIEVMAQLEADSVDAVVTDPPYGLGFMGKAWDHGVPVRAFWEEMYRVTKPGGYLLAFGGTRTVHRIATNIEDAGWIIRDMLMWIYASGFPKGKANLKPAHEPIVLARKPGKLRPLGIDECRIGFGPGEDVDDREGEPTADIRYGDKVHAKPGRRVVTTRKRVPVDGAAPFGKGYEMGGDGSPAGRWPSNVLLSSPELFDEPNPYVVGSGAIRDGGGNVNTSNQHSWMKGGAEPFLGYDDIGGYSRFFIIPKADRAERERGLESLALMLHRERGECDKLPAWESPGQSQSEPTDSSSPERVISDGPAPAGDSSSSGTSSPGKPPTAQSPRATRSTTSTGTSRTTPSPTSSSLTPLPTSESTPGASLSMGFGGSPAPSASSSDPSGTNGGTSPEKDGPSTDGADPATSARWSSRNACADCGKPLPRGSSHPTVKPIDLMRHLVRLVCPPGGQILDPFLGSGTTCLAASEEGFKSIGIERELEYLEIAKGRLMATPMGLGLDVPAPTRKPPKPELRPNQALALRKKKSIFFNHSAPPEAVARRFNEGGMELPPATRSVFDDEEPAA